MNQTNQISHHIGPRAFGWCNMTFTDNTRTWQHGYVNQDGRWVPEESVDRTEVVSDFHRLDNAAALRRGIRSGLVVTGLVIVVAAIVWGVI